MSSHRKHPFVRNVDFSYYLHRSTDPQTREEELRDCQLAAGGDTEAMERIILANVRYVIKYAEKATRARPYAPIDDVVQAGLAGLCRGVERFDPKRGVRLLTYATNWIRNGIQREMPDNLPVRIPTRYLDNSSEARDDEYQAHASQALAATVSESSIPLRIRRDFDSIDVFGFSEDLDPGDQAAENIDREAAVANLRRLLRRLSRRDRNILSRMFGLDGCKQETMARIGADLGITKERVRQVKERAIKKLMYLAGVAKE